MAEKELVDYLLSQGHSQERAEQIAGNHPDAIRAEMAKGVSDGKEKETAPAQEERAVPQT
jgi:hypothetical protein